MDIPILERFCSSSYIIIGIAGQMIGETDLAKEYLNNASRYDLSNITTAAARLRAMRMDN